MIEGRKKGVNCGAAKAGKSFGNKHKGCLMRPEGQRGVNHVQS